MVFGPALSRIAWSGIAEIEHLSLVAGGNRRGWRFDREHLHERA
ncbi:MAG: hypothetical protein OXP69_24005 [Spirochaetaceae bacterium]|nr:hypothetical protein [Spirochaetaceae bacterium]